MVNAFIMVKTEAGASESVVSDVRNVTEVSEAHIIAGDFDVIAEVDVEEVYEVMKIASSTVQGLEGVTDTRTYISLD